MTTVGYKRLVFALTALVVLSVALSGWLFVQLAWLKAHMAMGAEQTEIFEEMRAMALQSSPAQAAGCLEYTVNYYPSGTKQDTGSRLDQIVERHRASAVREIIAHLRFQTGQDLGDDASAWIGKFAPGK